MWAICSGTVKTTWKYWVLRSSERRFSSHSARASDWHFGQCLFVHVMESSPLRALWGVFSNGEPGGQKGMLHMPSCPFYSPLRLSLQKCQQFVGSLEFALAQIRRHNRFDGLQL